MLKTKYLDKMLKMAATSAVLSLMVSMPVFGYATGHANGSAVNIRSEASTSSDILGKLNKNDKVSPVGKESNFIKINHNGQTAFVSAEFITISSANFTVNTDSATVKSPLGDEVSLKLVKGDIFAATGQYENSLVFEHDGNMVFLDKAHADGVFKDSLPQVPKSKIPVTYAEVVSDSSLNLRAEPSTDASIVASLPKGDILDVLEKGNEWVKVQTHDNKTGYVTAEFVTVKTGVKPERKVAASEKGGEVVAYAKQFLGTPYRYGGTSLGSGVDCSGFVYAVYKNFGVTLNRTSSSMPSNGTKVSKSELVAGDLVFFSNGGSNIQHVGIYCGDGNFVHSASGKAMKVIVSGMGESYYVNNYITAARVLK